jgi:hypothetical protein
VLNQEFTAGKPNEKWVTDITCVACVATGEGWLYLASVMGLYSRKIVMLAHERSHDKRIWCCKRSSRLTAASGPME